MCRFRFKIFISRATRSTSAAWTMRLFSRILMATFSPVTRCRPILTLPNVPLPIVSPSIYSPTICPASHVLLALRNGAWEALFATGAAAAVGAGFGVDPCSRCCCSAVRVGECAGLVHEFVRDWEGQASELMAVIRLVWPSPASEQSCSAYRMHHKNWPRERERETSKTAKTHLVKPASRVIRLSTDFDAKGLLLARHASKTRAS